MRHVVGDGMQPPGTVIGVVGGRGGAGASVLATALAGEAAKLVRPVVLVDADPLGGGIDLVLGAEDQPGLRWPELSGMRGSWPDDLLVAGLPTVDGVSLVSWDRSWNAAADVPVEAVVSVMEGARAAARWVVVDLPRRLTAQSTAAVVRCDVILLVVPSEIRAATAARAVAGQYVDLGVDLRLVTRGPAPTGLDPDSIAEGLGLPLAGSVRAEPGLAEAIDRGRPPVAHRRSPLGTLCRALLAEWSGQSRVA